MRFPPAHGLQRRVQRLGGFKEPTLVSQTGDRVPRRLDNGYPSWHDPGGPV